MFEKQVRAGRNNAFGGRGIHGVYVRAHGRAQRGNSHDAVCLRRRHAHARFRRRCFGPRALRPAPAL